MESKKFTTVDEYISGFPADIQVKLEEIRQIIRAVIPKATECISYNMPAYKQNGVLVYFAANKSHIGFYPTASGISNFANELDGYSYSKGAIQFPFEKAIPKTLVRKIVTFRAMEDQAMAVSKKKK